MRAADMLAMSTLVASLDGVVPCLMFFGVRSAVLTTTSKKMSQAA